MWANVLRPVNKTPRVTTSSSYKAVLRQQLVVAIHSFSTRSSTTLSPDLVLWLWINRRGSRENHHGKETRVHCPYCRHTDSRVLDSRVFDDGTAVRRRRQCPKCERRFTTAEQMQLMVEKRSGVAEPFNREKAINGVRKACKGRPVQEDQLARLGQRVENTLRASGQCDIPADNVGLAILGPLRELDQVAYLRFASVYRQFQSADDFLAEINALRDVGTGDNPPIEQPPPEQLPLAKT